jgi:hypothetical protein
MKKTLLAAFAFLCLTIIANAQITKGSILLGGNVGFSNGKSESSTNSMNNFSSKSSAIYINPTVGIAVKENWIVGLSAGFSNVESDPSINYDNKRDQEFYSGGVFVRRYLALGKSFYLYGNGAISYQVNNQSEINSPNYENSYSSKGVNLSLAPGLAYAINKKFHLELALNDLVTVGYTTSRTHNRQNVGGSIYNRSSNDKSFGFGTNLSTSSLLSIGFRFVLGK